MVLKWKPKQAFGKDKCNIPSPSGNEIFLTGSETLLGKPS